MVTTPQQKQATAAHPALKPMLYLPRTSYETYGDNKPYFKITTFNASQEQVQKVLRFIVEDLDVYPLRLDVSNGLAFCALSDKDANWLAHQLAAVYPFETKIHGTECRHSVAFRTPAGNVIELRARHFGNFNKNHHNTLILLSACDVEKLALTVSVPAGL